MHLSDYIRKASSKHVVGIGKASDRPQNRARETREGVERDTVNCGSYEGCENTHKLFD